jgi:hypothetical protein
MEKHRQHWAQDTERRIISFNGMNMKFSITLKVIVTENTWFLCVNCKNKYIIVPCEEDII